MTFIHEVARALCLRSQALHALSKRGVSAGLTLFCAGFLSFSQIRASVYAEFYEPSLLFSGFLGEILRSSLLQALLFLLLAYVPSSIIFSNTITGDGLGLMLSPQEYKSHVAALFPLWGALFLIAAPMQWLLPRFLTVGPVEIGATWLLLAALLALETGWAIRELNYLSSTSALAVFVMAGFTLPVFWVLTEFALSLPFFILLPLAFVLIQRLRSFEERRSRDRELREHLQALTLNPRDADAHYQLGLLHWSKGDMIAAQQDFQEAVAIDSKDPAYHYWLGRTCAAREDWARAREQYEIVYRIDPQFGQGDIFREIGKAYFHGGDVEKAIEFFRFFLRERSSDPQGRYWLAVALEKTGESAQMRSELRTLLEHARSAPRFFRKENRQWITLARNLLRRR